MQTIIGLIQAHPAEIFAWAGLVALAFFNSMPTPGTKFSFYEWFYDGVHLFLSMRTQRTQQTIVTPTSNGGTMTVTGTSSTGGAGDQKLP